MKKTEILMWLNNPNGSWDFAVRMINEIDGLKLSGIVKSQCLKRDTAFTRSQLKAAIRKYLEVELKGDAPVKLKSKIDLSAAPIEIKELHSGIVQRYRKCSEVLGDLKRYYYDTSFRPKKRNCGSVKLQLIFEIVRIDQSIASDWSRIDYWLERSELHPSMKVSKEDKLSTAVYMLSNIRKWHNTIRNNKNKSNPPPAYQRSLDEMERVDKFLEDVS